MPTSTALVTGASRGIGAATVRQMWHSTASVTTLGLLARASDDFDALRAELLADNPHGKQLAYREIDLATLDTIPDTALDLRAQLGNIDILVNNAGYTNPVSLHQVELADFERTMSVNLYAPFLLVQSLLRSGNQFGVILNIASTAGIKGRAGWLTYSASKAALINMSDVMRQELAVYGTRVVCISPGRTATMLRRTLAPDEDPSTIMQAEHVAAVIETLLGPLGSFVDSENLVVRQ